MKYNKYDYDQDSADEEDRYALQNYNVKIKNRKPKKDKFTDKRQKQIVYQDQ